MSITLDPEKEDPFEYEGDQSAYNFGCDHPLIDCFFFVDGLGYEVKECVRCGQRLKS